jgi:iron complex outermembrane receptor protein
VVAGLPIAAHAQLDEIFVTAERRETNLQDTPISIQAFSAEALEAGGIERGSDLGIMVPNLVANPSGGGVGAPAFYIRGLPGVGIYIDGIWQSSYGFLESNFAEVERVEVLRGPQGTLFGRNTNGGAINITTRKPAEDFGMRLNLEVGEYNRRNATVAVDLPFTDNLKSKWMVSSLSNDGFLESKSVPRALGGQDDQIFRADILWEPTDNFNLRFTANDENKKGTEARILRFSKTTHPQQLRYNVLAGNPDFLAQARAVNPAFPASPFTSFFKANRFTPQTHETGFPGGELGKWETKSDTPADGIRRDLNYYTLTMNWDIGKNVSFQSISSAWELHRKQAVDFDGSEFTITTDEGNWVDNNFSQEFHLTGSNFNGRVSWLAGLYSLDEKTKGRTDRWALWDVPHAPGNRSISPTPRDRMSVEACQYLLSWATTVYGPAPPIAGVPCIAQHQNVIGLVNPAIWTIILPGSTATVNENHDEQTAFFGEVTVGVTSKLDLTLGVRVTDDKGRNLVDTSPPYIRNEVAGEPNGNLYGMDGTIRVDDDPDFGNNTTNKVAIQYKVTDDVMVYGSWSEGFTEATFQTLNLPVIGPAGCPQTVNVATPFPLNREIVTNREIGLRSDWRGGTVRFNATYFDAEWTGMRVNALPRDPCTLVNLPQPYLTSDGLGDAKGFELEAVYAPSDRWLLNATLGSISTAYRATGALTSTGLDLSGPIVVPLNPVNGTGIAPSADSPFAYAPDNSASLGLQYTLPLGSGGNVAFIGNYGWRDKYVRDAANQRIPVDENGNYEFEPAYGVLNSRVVFTPARGNWTASLWGTNLTDEQYVNGGFDARTVWGYDFSTIGPPREVGVTVTVSLQ